MTTSSTGKVMLLATSLALGQPWEELLERLDLDPIDLVPWRRRLIATTEPMTVADLRTVALRMQGHGPAAMRRWQAKHHTTAEIEILCLAAALRYAGDDAGPCWRLTRAGLTGQRLAREGLPPVRPNGKDLQPAFDRLWLEGRSQTDIRLELGIGQAAAQRLAHAAAPRWYGKDVAVWFGWSRENHRLRLANGRFPTPDGRDGSRQWWWPETVKGWARTQTFRRCPTCGARVQRLKQHSRAHD